MKTVLFTSYALVGSGKLARHLSAYLSEAGLPFAQWSRRNSAESLAQFIECHSHILLAVSDSALAELIAPLPQTKCLVHFSGALNVPGAFAAHPLMTFGVQVQGGFARVPMVLDPGVALAHILPGFANPNFALAPEKRALYHSLCSLAGNSTFLLWQKIGAQFETELGLPREILIPFLQQTVANALSSDAGSFTGPVARGDWATVRRHLDALTDSPELLSTYKNYLQLARSSGLNLPEAL